MYKKRLLYIGVGLLLLASVYLTWSYTQFDFLLPQPTAEEDWSDTKYLANFKATLPPLAEGESSSFEELEFTLPKEWHRVDTVGLGPQITLEPIIQAELYEQHNQVFLPYIAITHHELFRCASSKGIRCSYEDTTVPSTPEQYFEDYIEYETNDTQCQCTKRLSDRYLTGIGVTAAVFEQGDEGSDPLAITYIFLKDSGVYSVEITNPADLPPWFIDGFIDSVTYSATAI